MLHVLPTAIPPGPLSRQTAEALSKGLRDLYALLGGVDAAPPLTKRFDAGGFSLGIDMNVVADMLGLGGGSGGSGGAGEWKELDGTPDYTGITLVIVDQADGLSLSQPGAGQVRIDILPATTTQAGIVSLANQSMGAGQKYFATTVGIGTTSPLSVALDARGSVYVADTVYFGGGSSPASTAAGAFLQYLVGSGKTINLEVPTGDYTSGTAGGIQIKGTAAKFLLRHKTASARGYGYYNDDTSVEEDGITGTISPGATARGGLVMSLGTAASGGGSGGLPLRSQGAATAAGTTQGTAATFADDSTLVSGASGTNGIILPDATDGAIIDVWNSSGVSALKVYPPSGEQIGTLGTDNPSTVGISAGKSYHKISATQWGAAVLGS